MAWKYVGNNNKNIQYLCLSTDTKLNGDIGSILYVTDSKAYYINTDGEDTWEAFVQPKLES